MTTLTIPFQYADSIPLVHDEDTFAYIIDVESGEVVDEAYNFDTAINYIQDLGHVAVAVKDWFWFDGTVRATQAEVQAAFDHERRLQEDCFSLQAVAA
jgi:hypothetical protein